MPQGRKLLTELIRLVEFAEREELWEAGDLLAPMVEMLAPRLANRENIQVGKTT